MKSIRKTYLAALAVLLSPMANADIIVDNGFNNSSLDGNGWTNDGVQWRTWDDFTLNTAAILTSGSWKQRANGAALTTFYLDIVTNNGGSLGSSVFSTTLTSADVVTTSLGDIRYQYDLSIPNVNLAAGSYWISFSGRGLGVSMYGTNSGGDGIIQVRQAFNQQAFRGGEYIPFQLNGRISSVPEPGALALLGLGLAGICFVRRKKA